MIRIIDATLSLLDDYNLTREKIYCFIELMGGIGIRDLQVSLNTYYTVDGELPSGITYYLEVDTASYMNKSFPDEDENIKYYFVPKQKNKEKEVSTYHINDLEEPFRVENNSNNALMKIIGLDNLLLGGCNAGIEALKKKFGVQHVILCPEDTYHCATAIAILFLKNKGSMVVSSMLGVGNKAATEQILMALHVLERFMVNQKFKNFIKIRNWMEEVLEEKISPMAPVVGRRIFYVESGVHVDGILKKPTNYEPYEPELVGLNREVVIGKHSGKNSISYKLEQLMPESLTKVCIDSILEEVKRRSRRSGQTIPDEEFIKLIEGYERNEKNSKDC